MYVLSIYYCCSAQLKLVLKSLILACQQQLLGQAHTHTVDKERERISKKKFQRPSPPSSLSGQTATAAQGSRPRAGARSRTSGVTRAIGSPIADISKRYFCKNRYKTVVHIMSEIRIFVYAAAFATSAAESVDYSCAHSASWRMNQDDHTASNFGDVKTDVTSSAIYSASWMVGFNRIPNYDREFAHSDISTLNSRPEAATDFTSGATTAAAGNIYEFGDDIGYAHPGQSCSLGYWPPGPGCPTASTQSKAWDLNPAPESRAAGCYMPVLGSEGVWVR